MSHRRRIESAGGGVGGAVVVTTPGVSDLDIPIGSRDEGLSFAADFGEWDMGDAGAEGLNDLLLAIAFPETYDTADTLAEATGVLDLDIGAADSGDNLDAAGAVEHDLGDAAAGSFQGTAAATVVGRTTRTTNTAGDPWIDTANAEDADDDVAYLETDATLILGSHDGRMRCDLFAITGSALSGLTRVGEFVRIRHRWLLDPPLGSTASYTVELRDGAGVLLRTLKSESVDILGAGGGTSQPTLLTEVYDITADVAGFSAAQLEAIRVEFHSTANILILGSVTGAYVAWCHVETVYETTGVLT